MNKEERINLITENLRIAVNSCGKTREKVGEEVGVETRALRGYLSGSHTPTAWMLASLCESLGVSMDWVCGLHTGKKGE